MKIQGIILIMLAVLVTLLAIAAAVLWRKWPKVSIAMTILCSVFGILCIMFAVSVGLLAWDNYNASTTFALGEKAFAKKSWAKAINNFESVSVKYPYSEWTNKADMRANDARIEWAKSLPVEELARINELLDYVMKNGTTKQKGEAADIANTQATRLMDAGNKNRETFNILGAEMDGLFNELNALSGKPGDLTRGYAICQEIEGKINQQNKELQNAKSQYGEGIKLNISRDFREYFKLMVNYVDRNLMANGALLTMTEDIAEMISAAINRDSSYVRAAGKQADEAEKQYDERMAEADEIKKEADRLYDEKVLDTP